MARASRARQMTARTEQPCDHCDGWIRVGDTYHAWRIFWDPSVDPEGVTRPGGHGFARMHSACYDRLADLRECSSHG